MLASFYLGVTNSFTWDIKRLLLQIVFGFLVKDGKMQLT